MSEYTAKQKKFLKSLGIITDTNLLTSDAPESSEKLPIDGNYFRKLRERANNLTLTRKRLKKDRAELIAKIKKAIETDPESVPEELRKRYG